MTVGSTGGSGPDLFGPGPTFGERLARWAAEARAEEAALRRARVAFLRRADGDATTLVGVLLDLAEQAASVLVVTAGGRRHRGSVDVVGVDFLAVRTEATTVLLPLASVAGVHADGALVAGERSLPPSPVGFGEALALLAEERAHVLVVTAAEGIAGDLRWVGTDVVGVGSAYVPVAAIAEVVVG